MLGSDSDVLTASLGLMAAYAIFFGIAISKASFAFPELQTTREDARRGIVQTRRYLVLFLIFAVVGALFLLLALPRSVTILRHLRGSPNAVRTVIVVTEGAWLILVVWSGWAARRMRKIKAQLTGIYDGAEGSVP